MPIIQSLPDGSMEFIPESLDKLEYVWLQAWIASKQSGQPSSGASHDARRCVSDFVLYRISDVYQDQKQLIERIDQKP